LPSRSQLERADVTLIHDVLQPSVMCNYTAAVVAPVGERRAMWWILGALGRALGHDQMLGFDIDHATDDDVLAVVTSVARAPLSEVRAAAARGQPLITDSTAIGWVHERVLPDGPGRWDLAPADLVAQLSQLQPLADLVIIPQRQIRHQNTQLRQLGDRPDVVINPQDAAEAGVRDGDAVIVTSATGAVTGLARLTDDILPGVVSIPHGYADPCVNTLVSDTDVDPLTGMPRNSCTAVTLALAVGV
jgi:anaerobic selenocysteine-containing dehydrogenase